MTDNREREVEPIPGWGWPALLWIAVLVASAIQLVWQGITWPFRAAWRLFKGGKR